jgi:hypothetical protein
LLPPAGVAVELGVLTVPPDVDVEVDVDGVEVVPDVEPVVEDVVPPDPEPDLVACVWWLTPANRVPNTATAPATTLRPAILVRRSSCSAVTRLLMTATIAADGSGGPQRSVKLVLSLGRSQQ